MRTSLLVPGANCSTCFNATLDALGGVAGVHAVHGSIAAGCIEIDHDPVAPDLLRRTVQDHLHGVVMFSNEIRMVSLDVAVAPMACVHRPHG